MLTLRASYSAYIIFGLMWGGLSLLGFYNSLEHPKIMVQNTIIPLIGLIPFYLWLCQFKITASSTTISYRCLIGGTKTINRSEIEKYEIKIGQLETLHDRIKPFVRLNIFTNYSKEPSLEINLKVFNNKELQDFFHLLDADIQKNNEV